MIVRMWETPVRAGRIDELVAYVRTEVWPGVTAAQGFCGGEVLRSYGTEGERLVIVTRWADEAALEGFLGPSWAAHHVASVPAEEALLAGPPVVDHWSPVDVG